MEMECVCCHEPIQEDQPKCELQCHHFFHTACVFHYYDHISVRCPTCNEQIRHDDNISVNSEESLGEEDTRIKQLFEESDDFRRDITYYRDAYREYNKHRGPLQRLITEKKREIKPQYDELKQQIRTIRKTKKQEIKQSQVYKNYLSANLRCSKQYKKLYRIYDMKRYSFRSFKDIRGFKNIHYPRRWNDPQWMIYRAFRFRVGY